MRRKLLGLSQDQLAAALGLTFQQVQKYERGANRVSASKLYEAAKALQVSTLFFFEGLPPPGAGQDETAAADETGQAIQAFLSTSEGLELATLFPRIASSRVRRQILDLTRTLAAEDAAEHS